MEKRNPRSRIRPSTFHFSEKTRTGRYGDLRLLGLCIGMFLLCALGLIWSPEDRSKDAPSPAALAAGAHSTHPEPGQHAEPATFDVQDAGSKDSTAGITTTREKQEQALRDMAEQMPPDEVIIY
jgi:hypothetical protein